VSERAEDLKRAIIDGPFRGLRQKEQEVLKRAVTAITRATCRVRPTED
jgi:hypothetical protein